jgi:hypothetical protein
MNTDNNPAPDTSGTIERRGEALGKAIVARAFEGGMGDQVGRVLKTLAEELRAEGRSGSEIEAIFAVANAYVEKTRSRLAPPGPTNS